MKKSTLALSIAAAIGGLGLAGNALAVTDSLTGAPANSVLALNHNGIGHQLIFPYFTAQNGNATLLTITNTDTANGKLVKVRFRGAANSDDLYDFQVALSPGDIWTAAVTKDATTGAASLATSDKSCTLPASVNGNFNLDRVDGRAPGQTLEGYVEVINMANIAPNASGSTVFTTGLFTAIKHVSGVAPCTAAVLASKLGADNTNANLTATQADGSNAVGLAAPTTGLTGDWIIMNQLTTAAWSGVASALEVQTSSTNSAPVAGNLVFYPQTTGTPRINSTAVAAATAATGQNMHVVTADPLLVSGVVAIQNYDLPDLSTPYAASATIAATQADNTAALLAVKSVSNQYVTDTAIAAVTDLLMTQPMRRYSAAVNYKSLATTSALGVTTSYPFNTTGSVATPIYRASWGTGVDAAGTTAGTTGYIGVATAHYGPSAGLTGTAITATASAAANLTIPSGTRNLCLTTVKAPGSLTIFDREEITPSSSSTTSFIISPATPAASASVRVCGEAAVISINNGGTTGVSALGASLARSDFTSSSLATYNNGWVVFETNNGLAISSGGTGIPVLGQSFIRAANGSVNYGFGYSNKVTR